MLSDRVQQYPSEPLDLLAGIGHGVIDDRKTGLTRGPVFSEALAKP